MPAAWISAGVGAIGLIDSMGNDGSSGGGGGGGAGSVYSGKNLNAADQGWYESFLGAKNAAGDISSVTSPLYSEMLQNLSNINYQPYLQGANDTGIQYGNLSSSAFDQQRIFGNQADLARREQSTLYGAGNQILQAGMDPRYALRGREEQQVTDQVRAGLAARGLGNSAVGAGVESQALSDFDINWQNQQLAREQQAIQGATTAANQGGRQGELVGANLAASLGAGEQGINYGVNAYTAPIQAQQYVYGRPGDVASQYAQGMGVNAANYGNVAGLAIPYLYQGQGANQWNYAAQAKQNESNMNLLTQGVGKLADQYKTPGTWLNNTFNSPKPTFTGDVNTAPSIDDGSWLT